MLTETQRKEIFDRVLALVDEKSVVSEPSVTQLRDEHERAVLTAATTEDFELGMNAMLKRLGRHAGLFNGARPRSPSRIAFAATSITADTPRDGRRHVFADVHPGGPADRAGAKPGDIVLSVDGAELAAPANLPFSLGQSYTVVVRRGEGTVTITIDVPTSGSKERPLVVPTQVVTTSKIAPDIGLLRVTMFPGNLGMDVARDMTKAIRNLGTSRLIVDTRGNSGGGAGFLRLISLLCAERRGVGYFANRGLLRRTFDKAKLPRLDRIPQSQLGVAGLVCRIVLQDWRALRDKCVALYTEGLGAAPHHGRVVMLVNEFSASATEIVAAVAAEEGLATLVGTKTAGGLGGAHAWDVAHGYRVALPVLAFFTWRGTEYDGRGITPHIQEPLDPEALWDGGDNQLARARAALDAAAG